ncbi:MAG TPA: hypothetical protein VLU43_02700 [Anaeromyxobacteraceae bacterium]|nr:hypothetical protein [Anaeromyxobacteraceae bacterium]
MNILALIAAELRKSAPLFVVWVALCFGTVLSLRMAYGVTLGGHQSAGMAIFWGLVLVAFRGVSVLLGRRRAQAQPPSERPNEKPGSPS